MERTPLHLPAPVLRGFFRFRVVISSVFGRCVVLKISMKVLSRHNPLSPEVDVASRRQGVAEYSRNLDKSEVKSMNEQIDQLLK